ncbi:MAG: hypothetical protein II668_02720, partial [Oscillospiraceae bacterium]|nr:hypothetical protein [Oscillospiraceae bacterium]
MLVEVFLVSVGIYDICPNLSDRFQCTGIDACINLHPPGIEHRTEQRIVFRNLAQQNRYTEQLQRGHGN